MSNRAPDTLFQLIRSLEKSEKRHFKLYIKRNSANEDLKTIQLFDALDRMKAYDERLLLKRLPNVQKSQLSNLKAYLYKQLLASLRLLKSSDSIDLQLNEQFDYAHILYKKGLYQQSLRILEKAKETARANHKMFFLTQVMGLEKRIEALHITGSKQNKAEQLAAEAVEVSEHIDMVTRLSNLALLMFSWFVRYGHARNPGDEAALRQFMKDHLPANAWQQSDFYERLYLYQSFSWYAFIRQDFLMYYRYSQKWVDLFEAQPLMKRVETGHYIKGLHNLLNAHFDLRNFEKSEQTIRLFEAFAATPRVQDHDSFRVQAFVYITQAKINHHFMVGTFKEGLQLVPQIEEKLEAYSLFIDAHRVLVMNYKIATLYFGAGDYSTCIDYLQRIINDRMELRYDLQCYVRLLHLLAHYELGNFELMEYLTKSVYRYFAKKENLTVVEEEMFRFLRRSLSFPRQRIKAELEQFLRQIKQYEKDRYETRVFAYLDIISWVESKVYNKSLSEIIGEKYRQSRKRRRRQAVPSAEL